jgi:hypothetical protein
MSFPHLNSLLRRVVLTGIAAVAGVVLAAGLANAQTSPEPRQAGSAGISSSNDPGLVQISEAVAPGGLSSLPAAPTPSASAGGGGSKGWKQKLAGNYALEIGGGASIPTDKTYITWGEQFTVGGGYNFNKRFALLAEYQFMDNKLPGALIAETGANGGHAHIWSLTLDPVVSLFPKSSNDVYVTGGGGFYRKVTSFTDPQLAEYCDYYYCGIETVNTVVGHFSSNQGGFNIGGGYQHRMGGMYQDSKMKFFVEARYIDVLTPAVTTQPNGLGTTTVAAGTKLIPVSVGLRW